MRGDRFVASIVVLVALAAMVTVGVPQPANAAKRKTSSDGLSVVGKLKEPKLKDAGWVVELDARRRLMYYVYRGQGDVFLGEYDLRPEVPRLVRETHLGSHSELQINYASPYTMKLDTKRRVLYVLGENQIRVVDLNKFKVVGTWDLARLIPGLNTQGLTFSAKDGRLYLVGSMSGNQVLANNLLVSKPAYVSIVAALDAKSDPAEGPKLIWTKPIQQCQMPADTFAIRALIARSRLQNALYFACVRPDPWPGESGVVRLWIDPKGDQQAALGFDVDFFPISGSYTSTTQGIMGVAAFDPATDRFYLQSLAHSTPGAWVLDGRLSAWIGFITAPDNDNYYLGFDVGSGHYYMGSSDLNGRGGYMIVADGRSTPIQQGRVFPGFGVGGFIVSDPVTHRLFVRAEQGKLGLAKGKDPELGYVVLKDNTPLDPPPRPPHYDDLTSDIEEGPDTITTYSGGINGFGARAVAVGGYGGLLSASGQTVTIAQLRAGDRGFTAARVPIVDLRSGASTAKAQPFVGDSNTEAELYDGGVEEWPWAPASCFDGGGDPGTQKGSGPGGEAQVQCKLDSDQAEASSYFGRLSGEGVSIGDSAFAAETRRDAKKGVSTQAEAVARGIDLRSPAGTVSIAEVRATASTVAYGRPKTAHAKWTRVLSGIEIRDAEGKVVRRVGECVSSPKVDECENVIAQANEILQTRMRIDLPSPDVVATPKGAFAAVGQDDAGFFHARTVYNQGTTFGGEAASRALPAMQIVVFNDAMEKSRLIFQLAALQSNSIYTVSPRPEFKTPKTPSLDDVVEETVGGTSGGPGVGSGSISIGGGQGLGDTGPIDAVAAPTTGIPAAVQAVRAFLTRPLTESLLVAAVWLLFLGAGAGVYKRRALLSIINGGGL